MLGSYTVTRRHIPMTGGGRPLGRHVHHDSRSLEYQITPDGTIASVVWPRHIPILDQGNLGSCTGNAAVGLLGTGGVYDALAATFTTGLTLNEDEAVTIYSDAEKVDGGQGYPPEDQGSSGLSVAKVAKSLGFISGYQHATSLAAAQTAIQKGAFAVGSNWYTSMDNPTAEGVVTVSGTVRGGHEYICRQYDAQRDLWWLDNSWGMSFGVQGRFAYSSADFSRLLSEQGDVTQFVPLTQPAPTPTPVPTPTPSNIPAPVLTFHNSLPKGWTIQHHIGENEIAAKAAKALLAAYELTN